MSFSVFHVNTIYWNCVYCTYAFTDFVGDFTGGDIMLEVYTFLIVILSIPLRFHEGFHDIIFNLQNSAVVKISPLLPCSVQLIDSRAGWLWTPWKQSKDCLKVLDYRAIHVKYGLYLPSAFHFSFFCIKNNKGSLL